MQLRLQRNETDIFGHYSLNELLLRAQIARGMLGI
jgi:hypothetical protein